jgi:hypothetical protein
VRFGFPQTQTVNLSAGNHLQVHVVPFHGCTFTWSPNTLSGKNCSSTLTFSEDGWPAEYTDNGEFMHPLPPKLQKFMFAPFPPPPVLVGISPAFDAISCGERWMVAKNAYFYISYPFAKPGAPYFVH